MARASHRTHLSYRPVLIVWSLYRYWHVNQGIEKARFRPLHRAVLTFAVLLVLLAASPLPAVPADPV